MTPAEYGAYARSFMNDLSPFLKLTDTPKPAPGLVKIDYVLAIGDANDAKLTDLAAFFNFACVMGVEGFTLIEECDREHPDSFSIGSKQGMNVNYVIQGTNPQGQTWFPIGQRAFYKTPLPVWLSPFEVYRPKGSMQYTIEAEIWR